MHFWFSFSFPQQSERCQSYSIPNYESFFTFIFNFVHCLFSDTVIIFSWCILYLRCFLGGTACFKVIKEEKLVDFIFDKKMFKAIARTLISLCLPFYIFLANRLVPTVNTSLSLRVSRWRLFCEFRTPKSDKKPI